MLNSLTVYFVLLYNTINCSEIYIVVETLSEDEDDLVHSTHVGMSPSHTANPQGFVPTPGGPFSALTPSMWPEDILTKLSNQVR